MIRITLLILTVVGSALAQVPGLGFCPDYAPMADFDLSRFQGIWYESERYFTFLEAASKCVKSNYSLGADGKYRVSNEISNRFTGIRRVVDGYVQNIGKGGEGRITVRYTSLPVPVDTQYSVLDTDYESYAVVWSCNSVGPVNTQSAWIMTRDPLAPGTVLQKAYGVLDKNRISRNFFVKTDQTDCTYSETPIIEPEKEKEGSNKVEGASEQLPSKLESVEKPTKEYVEPQFQPVIVETVNPQGGQVPVFGQQIQNGANLETVYLKPYKDEAIHKVSETIVSAQQPVGQRKPLHKPIVHKPVQPS